MMWLFFKKQLNIWRNMRTTDKIINWANDRNLIQGSSITMQYIKLSEEQGELAEAIAKGRPKQALDSIGDMCVVLAILAAQYGSSLEDCIDIAYDEIKDRKGRMQNGVFIKEGD